MKFVALLPVRDEGDVIAECLEHALTWADSIYVFDTGSVDNTWDIVQDFAHRDRRVIPLARDPVYFSENLVRGYLFDRARTELRDGDCFVRLDADEFHHISPREFRRNYMRPTEGVAYHQYYNFALRNADLELGLTLAEIEARRRRPVVERLRHYSVSSYSEPRMAVYRDSMAWPAAVSFPYNAGLVARERLPIRHYPHRDALQLERRCLLRHVMMSDPRNRAHWQRPEEHHWSEAVWRTFVSADDDPELHYWSTDVSLPRPGFATHLPGRLKRSIQEVFYATPLPRLADAFRRRWQPGAFPQRIDEATTNRLLREMGQAGDLASIARG